MEALVLLSDQSKILDFTRVFESSRTGSKHGMNIGT